MHFSRSLFSSSASGAATPPSSSSFLLVPLLIGLALSTAFSSIHAAPTAQKGNSDAASKAAKLSRVPTTSSNQLNVHSAVNDTSPWKEVHRIALPKPDSSGVVNTTTVANDVVTTNITTPAGKHIVTNSTVKEFKKNISQFPLNASSSKSSISPAAVDIDCSDEPASSSLTTALATGTTSAQVSTNTHHPKHPAPSCFPALNFTMPDQPPNSLDGWWCSPKHEYAFMGFSYGVDACQSQAKLTRDFKNARKTFNARYVRLYSVCDEDGFYDRVVEAAWEAGIGVQALIWFGFDGTDIYKQRRAALFKSIRNNPKAKFVTRAIQFGSEPLFDWAISGTDLAKEVIKAKNSMKSLGINITVSEMAYGYQSQTDSGSKDVLKAVDFIDAHMLPYFSQTASTGDKAWKDNKNDMDYFVANAPGKKVYWSQTGWPSTHDCNAGVCPNSPNAVSNVKNEKAYFDLLDRKCETLKQYSGGGVGWFAHMYSDDQGAGYGIYGYDGKTKFDFNPRTSC